MKRALFAASALALGAALLSSPTVACNSSCTLYEETQQAHSTLAFQHSQAVVDALAAYYASYDSDAGEGGAPLDAGRAGAPPDAGAPVNLGDGDVEFMRAGNPCANGASGCLELTAPGFSLTFVPPSAPGTTSLESLSATICEKIPSPPPGDPNAFPAEWQWGEHCTPLKGELDTRAIALGCDDQRGHAVCAWFDGTLTVEASAAPSDASLVGTFSISDRGVAHTVTCGTIGSPPGPLGG